MLNLWVSLKCTLSTLSISICEFSHSLIFKQSRRLGKLSTLWGNTELLVEWSNFQVLDMCHKVSMTEWPSLRHDICQQIYATAVFGPRNLRKKSINRDKIKSATKQRKCHFAIFRCGNGQLTLYIYLVGSKMAIFQHKSVNLTIFYALCEKFYW